MKKILNILVLLLVVFVINAQDRDRLHHVGNAYNGRNVGHINKSITRTNEYGVEIDTIISRLDADSARIDSNDAELLIHNTMLKDTFEMFYPKSWLTGTNYEQAIQSAVDAASDIDRGGIVWIGAGVWTFDSDSVDISNASNVTIMMHRAAVLWVPTGHTNTCVFYAGDGSLTNFSIVGGRFSSQTNQCDWVKMVKDGAGNYAQNCHFEYMHANRADAMFNLVSANSGYINAFTFDGLWVDNCKSFWTSSNTASDGMSWHLMTNILIQAGDSSVTVIDTLNGALNQIENLMVGDWSGGVKGKTIILGSDSKWNEIEGYFVGDSVVDLGTDNRLDGLIGYHSPLFGDMIYEDNVLFEDVITFEDSIVVRGKIKDRGYESTVGYVAKKNFTFASESNDTIIILPEHAVISDIKINVRTTFNDSGYDFIDVGRSDSETRFVVSQTIVTPSWLSLSLTDIPDRQSATRYITARYRGENDDATTGSVDVYIYYSLH